MFDTIFTMNFTVAPDSFQKLVLLDDTTRFEPAGSEPLEEKTTSTLLRKSKILPCIAEATTPAGKKPLLMGMLTTACERNCHYCVFRAGRSKTQRISFTPDEMAALFDTLQRAAHVDGIFSRPASSKAASPPRIRLSTRQSFCAKSITTVAMFISTSCPAQTMTRCGGRRNWRIGFR